MTEFTSELGVETVRLGDGECVMELELDERHMSTARRAHGGVLFAMLDTAMGRAVISRLPDGRGCATVEARINYFRPVPGGRVRAEAKLVRLTRQTAYAEGTLLDGAGHMLARSSGTFFLTETLVRPTASACSAPPAQGSSSTLPVVRRPSRARCASSAFSRA